MTAAASLASYAQASTATASPGEIVRMAYERILTACNRAEQAESRTPANWVQIFHDETMRAQAILLELTVGLALDHEDSAVTDLARHLDDLYRYCIDELVDANVYKDPEPLDDVRLVIEGLHDAWVRR